MSPVKVHSFITRRPGPAMYAFEFKVARALIQQNISGQIWIIYDPEISVKSVCSKGKNIQTKRQIRTRNRVTWQGTCSLYPPQRLLWVTETKEWGNKETSSESLSERARLCFRSSPAPHFWRPCSSLMSWESLWRRKLLLQECRNPLTFLNECKLRYLSVYELYYSGESLKK